MRTVESRLQPFVHLITDLVLERHTDFPHLPIQQLMERAFDASPSWNWRGTDGNAVFTMLHPWQEWATTVRPVGPQTVARVPRSMLTPGSSGCFDSFWSGREREQQISIPYLFDGVRFGAFVLARGGRDFSDEDLDLAIRIQPLLLLLHHHVSALAQHSQKSDSDGLQLTGREMAVLRLLADGLTAAAIGHRLGSSPRTVQKHLEHIYRKLGVTNRTTALRVAAEADLIPAAPRLHAVPDQRTG